MAKRQEVPQSVPLHRMGQTRLAGFQQVLRSSQKELFPDQQRTSELQEWVSKTSIKYQHFTALCVTTSKECKTTLENQVLSKDLTDRHEKANKILKTSCRKGYRDLLFSKS